MKERLLYLLALLRGKAVLRCVLAGLLLLTALVLVADYFKMRRQPQPFQAYLACQTCKKAKAFELLDRGALPKCPFCGGSTAYLYKCDDCHYEFPYKPISSDVMRKLPDGYQKSRVLEQRCPNCQSLMTHEASPPPAKSEKP